MLPPLTQIPEPWRSLHERAMRELDPEWLERYGESSLRAAAAVLGDSHDWATDNSTAPEAASGDDVRTTAFPRSPHWGSGRYP